MWNREAESPEKRKERISLILSGKFQNHEQIDRFFEQEKIDREWKEKTRARIEAEITELENDEDSEKEDVQEVKQKPKLEPEQKEEITEEELRLYFGEDFKLRKQDPSCNEKGRACMTWLCKGKERHLCYGFKTNSKGELVDDIRECKHKKKEEEKNEK